MHPDERVARLAAAQHGVVSTAQLRTCGLTRTGIDHRRATGRLHRLHRGVYAVGDLALPPLAAEAAAVLACGPTAVLSHRTAAAMWGLAAPPEQPQLTLTRGDRRRPGIIVHRVKDLAPRDVRTKGRLPLTAPVRTILDLAPHLNTRALERITADALARRLATERELRERGGERMRALLDGGARRTRSEAERELLELIRAAGLPPPETNQRVHGYEVDALWRDRRLAVEIDGYAFHGHRIAFERDRRRDIAMTTAGVTTVRVTWRQLRNEREAVVAALARALA